MSEAQVAVVIPTLTADFALTECLQSLRQQTFTNFEVVVVDNSGNGLVRNNSERAVITHLIENPQNVGFGTAINQGWRRTRSRFVATLNDDAIASRGWIAALLEAAERHGPIAGMYASRVRLLEQDRLDSAGMLIASDGTSKQRGHGQGNASHAIEEEVLLPSGSAAMYRREMLDDVGGFDDDFFLYCEDTDLGLRARWRGWTCIYVPGAVVEHRYSHSAGRASALKAYYVERNRLYLVAKNFPTRELLRVPFSAAARYLWHVFYMAQGKGAASQYRSGGPASALLWFVLRAHCDLLRNWRSLLLKRRLIQAEARIGSSDFSKLLEQYRISTREVASL